MPIIERNEVERRWWAMRSQAEERGHLDPPSYSDEGRRGAWRSGYLDALRDVAQGRVDAR
jgi:hypothetical protein